MANDWLPRPRAAQIEMAKRAWDHGGDTQYRYSVKIINKNMTNITFFKAGCGSVQCMCGGGNHEKAKEKDDAEGEYRKISP